MTMRRDIHQRRAYALHRLGLAVDRQIRAKTKAEKEQATRWAAAWGTKTGLRPFPKD